MGGWVGWCGEVLGRMCVGLVDGGGGFTITWRRGADTRTGLCLVFGLRDGGGGRVV